MTTVSHVTLTIYLLEVLFTLFDNNSKSCDSSYIYMYIYIYIYIYIYTHMYIHVHCVYI